MPSGCSRLMPPKEPLGLLSTGSMRLLLKSFGDVPSARVMTGASSARAIRTRIMIPAAIATLSRLRRIHAIWPSERPSMRPGAPARTASASACCSPLVTSSGTPTTHLPARSPRRAPLRGSERRDTTAPPLIVDRFSGPLLVAIESRSAGGGGNRLHRYAMRTFDSATYSSVECAPLRVPARRPGPCRDGPLEQKALGVDAAPALERPA